MKIIPETPEERLMCALFGEEQFYSAAVIGTGETIELKEGVRRALDSLPLTKGKKDAQPWARLKKIIELKFGFATGKIETFQSIGQDFHVTRTAIQQQERKALRLLRHPRQQLRSFVPLSYREIEELKFSNKALLKENRLLEQSNRELTQLLENAGTPRSLIEAHSPDNLEKADLNADLKEQRSIMFISGLAARFPGIQGSKLETRTWNNLRRYGPPQFAPENIQELKTAMDSGKISLIIGIGAKSIAFLKEVIQTIENEKG